MNTPTPQPDPPETAPSSAAPRPRRRRWWRRKRVTVTAAVLMLLAVGVTVTGYWYTRPQRLGRITAEMLTGMTRAQTRVDKAVLHRDGTLEVTGLRMRVPGIDGAGGELFSAERVVVRQPLVYWLMNAFEPTLIALHRPRLHVTELTESGVYNHTLLAASQGPPREQFLATLPGRLPEIEVNNGRIDFGQMPRDGQFAVTGSLAVHGSLNPGAVPGAFGYAVKLTDTTPSHAGPATTGEARGEIALKEQRVTATFSPMSFDPVLGDFLPRAIRDWYHRMEPRGTVPTFTLKYTPTREPALAVELGLDDVALTLPRVGLRMQEVQGRFRLHDQRVEVEQLEGTIEGLRYRIDGQLDGLSADAPFELTLRTDPFEVERRPDFVPLMPEAVKKGFQRFAPRGTFRAEVTAGRDTQGEDFNVSGKLTFLDAGLTYHDFAYPLTRGTGAIRFTREQIVIDQLRGIGPSGAVVTVNGTVTPPGDGAEVRLRIVADQMPIDEHLIAAMEPKHQKALAFCADTRAYQRLVNAGLIRTDHTQPGDAPVFTLAGTTRLEVDVHRPQGMEADYRVTTAIDMAGLGVLFEPWPYPMTATGGTLRLTPGRVLVEQITTRGPTGATGTIHGTVDYPRHGPGQIQPKLNITNARVPLDGLLVASLGAKRADWLKQLGLSGDVTAKAVIDHDDTGVGFTVHADVLDARANPFHGSAVIDRLAGGVTIRRNRVVLRELTGTLADAPVTLTGQGDFSNPTPELELFAEGNNLRLEDKLLGLIPPDTPEHAAAEKLIDQYRASGTFDASLIWRTGALAGQPDSPEPLVLTARPRTLSLTYRDRPIQLNDMDGRITLTPGLVQLTDVTATTPDGRATVSGTIRTSQPMRTELTIDAAGDELGPTTRAVLPASVVDAIDALEIAGDYRLRGASLVFDPGGPGVDDDRSTFTGSVTTQSLAANLGVMVDRYRGRIGIEAKQNAGEAIPRFQVTLDGDAARVEQRWVGPVRVELSNQRDEHTLHLERFEGTCYGGSLHGSGRVSLVDDRAFRFELFLQNVALQPFLTPAEFPGPLDDDAVVTTRTGPDAITGVAAQPEGGVLHAGMSIFGIPGRPETRRGRGELTIYDARLYEVPLALAVVQIANLSNPSSRAFDRSGASFVLDGDTVALSRIFFETPTQVQIAGDGTMKLSSRELDLTMFSRKPTGQRLGPLSDLVDLFKDELIRVRVTGTLNDPESRVESFGGLSDSIKDIFLGRNRPAEPKGSP